MKIKISPCPFCKSNDTELITVFISYGTYVVCNNCEAIGPKIHLNGVLKDLEKQQNDAIKYWNNYED